MQLHQVGSPCQTGSWLHNTSNKLDLVILGIKEQRYENKETTFITTLKKPQLNPLISYEMKLHQVGSPC